MKISRAKRLTAYSLLAGSFLALSNEAEGQVVYTAVDSIIDNGEFMIDFDLDGVFDANVLNLSTADTYMTYSGYVTNIPTDIVAFDGLANPFVGYGAGFIYASALASGALIGGTAIPNVFAASGTNFSFATMNYGDAFGAWTAAGTIAFLGLEFTAGSGSAHYAWIRVEVFNALSCRVIDYAYDATASTPIIAGFIPPSDPVDPATGLIASDVGDEGNGADLELSFSMAADETDILEYRLIAVKSTDTASFDLAAAQAVAAGNFLSVTPSGTDIMTVMGAGANDRDGTPIVNGIEYTMYVLSVGDPAASVVDALSVASNPVTLTTAADVASDVQAVDVGDAMNGTDMNVSFDMATDESGIAEYRIMVVKAADLASFDLAAAEAVPTGNYFAVSPVGGNISTTLDATSNATDGTLIANDIAYNVVVMSLADGAIANTNTLSGVSPEVTLTTVSGINDPAFAAQLQVYSFGDKLNVAFDGPQQEMSVEIYNSAGKQLKNYRFNGSIQTFQTGLTAGTYLVKISSIEGKVNTRQLFIH